MSTPNKTRLLIMGAAGRDFHDFNVYWKNRTDVEVVCFTATQIPDIEGRVYPPQLSGSRYPQGRRQIAPACCRTSSVMPSSPPPLAPDRHSTR